MLNLRDPRLTAPPGPKLPTTGLPVTNLAFHDANTHVLSTLRVQSDHDNVESADSEVVSTSDQSQ